MMNAGAVGHLWLCLKDQAMSELVCGVNVQKYFRNVLVCVLVFSGSNWRPWSFEVEKMLG